jgi:hypothetical protein
MLIRRMEDRYRVGSSKCGMAGRTADTVEFRAVTTIPEGHKSTHYFETCEVLFGPGRSGLVRVLEIGFHTDNSLRLWRNYFHHHGTVVVGIDNCS